ncbi:Protein ANTAGONIST OF LIKE HETEROCHROMATIN PROTEIN 1 [Frankliniella fusca]|uniref:Protein ANTAGONIST OF LIKE HETEROCHROMATIN PROTEIN 1 n=1 Tax=Frankliniella fusca TaxID=407009 RepID=A0AAE1H3W2_9NEOP|nr:Protein ANTAGONIST OF LIKE HETEROCHROMATIN PROTEIN 1 [Frankliniella fusca]
MAEAFDDEFMFFFDDDDDAVMAVAEFILNDNDLVAGEKREETITVDIEGWRRLSNASFKQNFRMDRIVFEKLIVAVGLHMRNTNRIKRFRTNFELCLMMGLWPLFNPDTFRSSAHHFGKKRATIHYHYSYLIEVLTEMSHRYIKWPNALEREEMSSYFEQRFGYPGIVRAIDGTYVHITAPLVQSQRYVNRHHRYSILVQAVCDHRLPYRDVYNGEAGSIGDARNFEKSPLSSHLLLAPDRLSDGQHIVGDGAYTLTDKLMKPYSNDGRLTGRQLKHNLLLSACRSAIERSFCLIKGKDRRLKQLEMRNPYLVEDHIVSCFVIHKFIILEGEDAQGLPPLQLGNVPEAEYQRLKTEAMNTGSIKREYIANLLSPEDD